MLRWFKKQVPTDRAERGRFGEREAARYLKGKGLRVLVRNWRHGHDEIDLVCLDGEVLVFVEVRTRDALALVDGYHSVTQAKKDKLRRVCRAYLKALPQRPGHTRFDIVAVSLGPQNQVDVSHYAGVFLLG